LKDKEQAPEGTSSTQVRWKAPSTGFQKANWDVPVDKLNGCLGARILVRDKEGRVIVGQSLTKEASPDPIVAEAMGAPYVAKICRELGQRHIILEGNALQVVNAMKS
jgi:hypothetical protein